MSAQPDPMPHLGRIAAAPVVGDEMTVSVCGRTSTFRVVEVDDAGEPVVRRVAVES